MTEISESEISQVNGGNRVRLAWAVLSYIGSRIIEELPSLAESMSGGNGNTSSGGQMNSERRSNMFG